MDGLLAKINYDFLLNLKRLGLVPSSIRVKYVSRDSKVNTLSSTTFNTLDQFITAHSSILDNRKYLCSAGEFPIIQNLILTNINLNFSNTYTWYDITGSKRLVRSLPNDPVRQTIYETQTAKYLDLMYKKIDEYINNARTGISVRLNSYVDPCYVDAGYVSPNYD